MATKKRPMTEAEKVERVIAKKLAGGMPLTADQIARLRRSVEVTR
jgi:hypothetical protein